jgi:ribonuclease-3
MTKRRSQPAEEDSLESRIGYRFRDPALLQLALTHSSLAFEQTENAGRAEPNRTDQDNEQLEFLGDAIAGLVITELLVEYFAGRREGDLTRMRAMLVSGKSLAEAAIRLRLGESLLLGRGEESSGGRTKGALLADAVEALIAAMYLDANRAGKPGSGLQAARKFVEREIFQPRLPDLAAAAEQGARFGGIIGDWKSALQEFLQGRAEGQPHYRTVEEIGHDHNKTFRVEVLLHDRVLAQGEGASKKSAQQAAAHIAYDLLAPQPAVESA